MKRRKYYGVAGSNGYGVYDNYDRVLESRPFITEFTIKKLKTLMKQKSSRSMNMKDCRKGNWVHMR